MSGIDPAPACILVAGVGNMFLRDDGFGPEVARLMATDAAMLLPGVRAVDYGIRGMHLAYDLLDGVDALILVDTVPARRASGGNGSGSSSPAAETYGAIRVLQVRSEDLQNNHGGGPAALDPHGMDPVAVLDRLTSLGGGVPLTFVVGCVPGDLAEGIGLSAAVAAAIPEALSAIGQLIEEITERLPAIRRNGSCAWESLAG
ncbi:hydrogenase maturation protease [Arthrobacter terrae]|uniref:hydrogenase maturation protease n=1 Tax=Arthrobacter terrae TaxID=2935737 RepID=UPI0028AABD25|nr:hydrogenase maturation protease [Arthrobacter terrae]